MERKNTITLICTPPSIAMCRGGNTSSIAQVGSFSYTFNRLESDAVKPVDFDGVRNAICIKHKMQCEDFKQEGVRGAVCPAAPSGEQAPCPPFLTRAAGQRGKESLPLAGIASGFVTCQGQATFAVASMGRTLTLQRGTLDMIKFQILKYPNAHDSPFNSSTRR